MSDHMRRGKKKKSAGEEESEGGEGVSPAFPPMSHCFFTQTLVVTQHVTTVAEAHLYSRVTPLGKTSAR